VLRRRSYLSLLAGAVVVLGLCTMGLLGFVRPSVTNYFVAPLPFFVVGFGLRFKVGSLCDDEDQV
jgi:hypothetical protein